MRLKKGLEIERVSGFGFIPGSSKAYANNLTSDFHFIPATVVTLDNSLKLSQHINSTLNPTTQQPPHKANI